MSVWTILIATIGERRDRFSRLLDVLLPQVERAQGAVTIEALWNNGERPLGRVRQDLVEHATSTYVNFIDDDDMVPPYYVEKILPLLDGVDYVGFRATCWIDGEERPPVTISTRRSSGWVDLDTHYFRDVTHLNPIRRVLALQWADFCRGNGYEDRSWSDQMRGHIKTEAFVDEVLYLYHASTSDGFTHRRVPPRRNHAQRLAVDSPYFSYHPASS